jgi:hypothetical protein
MLARSRPEEHADLQRLAQSDADERRRLYEQLSGVERQLPGRMARNDEAEARDDVEVEPT